MKKIKLITLALALILALFSFNACAVKDVKCTVVKEADHVFAITVDEVSGSVSMLDVMKTLAGEGKLSFRLDGTMVAGINGVENGGSSYWFLYSSDTDSTSSAFGSYELDGQTLYSSVLGADALLVKAGHTYVWAYSEYVM